jgi:hypothetical protein
VKIDPPGALPQVGQLQITARDRQILAVAAEHRFVLAAQLALLLGIAERAAAERMRALGDEGYLSVTKTFRDEPPIHQVTTAGLRAIGSDLPRPRPVNLSNYRHDAGLAWLTVGAARGMFGPLREIVGERRMRSEDLRGDGPATTHGVRIGGAGHDGRPRLHYPDLVLVTDAGHRVAVELELSTKGRQRRERILGAYGADRRVDAVLYLVDHPSRRRAIERSVRRLGLTDLVRVQPVRLGHDVTATAAEASRVHQRPAARAQAGR